VFELMTTLFVQRCEFEADKHSTTLTNAADMRSALIKVHRDHLEFPMSDWLYWRWYYSHPPLMDRLDQLQ